MVKTLGTRSSQLLTGKNPDEIFKLLTAQDLNNRSAFINEIENFNQQGSIIKWFLKKCTPKLQYEFLVHQAPIGCHLKYIIQTSIVNKNLDWDLLIIVLNNVLGKKRVRALNHPDNSNVSPLWFATQKNNFTLIKILFDDLSYKHKLKTLKFN
ncbi:MAG: hypothetical protein JWM09_303 [Francisellaceae bacterium]|nr:hypothetical protein [Francisellaceae bacterium]